MVLSILGTIAKQERIRISERVHAGLARARKQGRIGGRPRLILSHAKVLALGQEGCTIREIAEEMGVSPASIHRRSSPPYRRCDSCLTGVTDLSCSLEANIAAILAGLFSSCLVWIFASSAALGTCTSALRRSSARAMAATSC